MIIEVNNHKTEKHFLGLPAKLYRNDPLWVPPLHADIKSVFDARKNSILNHGDCARWLATDPKGNVIGRIAAFVDFKKAAGSRTPAGGAGFFECIHDKQVAHNLFDTAADWLRKHGMQGMEGPVNFGENEKFWGLLVKGFEAPSYGMNYNPPYYETFFNSYGFVKAYDQLTNVLDARQPLPERFARIADWVMKKDGYSFRHFTLRNKEEYFREFQEVYNDAWQDFHDFHPLSVQAIRESFRQMEPIADEKIIWFAYYKSEPIAFILCMPDINPILRKLGGRMHMLNKIRFWWLQRTTPAERLRIIVMGCKKKFQNHGVESALISCLKNEVIPRNTVREVELAWVADFNKKMLALHHATGARLSKVHRTYHYTFD